MSTAVMQRSFEENLAEYAKLAVREGLALAPGQELLVFAEIDHAALVRQVVETLVRAADSTRTAPRSRERPPSITSSARGLVGSRRMRPAASSRARLHSVMEIMAAHFCAGLRPHPRHSSTWHTARMFGSAA